MKIYYDISIILTHSGVPVYTKKLLKELSAFPELEMYCAEATLKKKTADAIRSEILANAIDSLRFRHIPLPGRLLEMLPARLRDCFYPEVDIFHAPANFFPKLYPGNKSVKKILTLHDVMAFSDRVEDWGLTDLRYLDDHLKRMKESVEMSDFIITVSDFTKTEACRLFNLPPEKVKSIHIAPQGNFVHNPGFAQKVLADYGLNEQQYYLSVSTISKRKNYWNLLDAFEKFVAKHPKAKLVIVGNPGWNYDDILSRMEAMKEHVIWIKYCDWEALGELYYHARAFFLVSWYEGFGIPILEAMQAGCPVCYATGSAMTEIAEDNGIAVEPDAVDQIEHAMHRLWDDDELYERLSASGAQVASKFNWQNTAKETYGVYQEILG